MSERALTFAATCVLSATATYGFLLLGTLSRMSWAFLHATDENIAAYLEYDSLDVSNVLNDLKHFGKAGNLFDFFFPEPAVECALGDFSDECYYVMGYYRCQILLMLASIMAIWVEFKHQLDVRKKTVFLRPPGRTWGSHFVVPFVLTYAADYLFQYVWHRLPFEWPWSLAWQTVCLSCLYGFVKVTQRWYWIMYQCFDPTERRKRRELIAISRDIPRSDSGVELEEVDESVEEADLLAEKLRAIDVRPAPDEEEDEMENSRGRHHTRRRRDGSESPPPQRFRPEIGRALVRNGHAHLSSHGTANVRIPGPGFSQQPALFRRTVSTGFGLEQKASFQSPFHASVSHTPAPISRTISDPSPLEGLYTAFNNKTVNVRSQAPQERPMQNSAWGTTSQATERQSPLLNFSASFASSLDEVRTQNGPDHRPFNTKSIPLRQSSNISPRAHNGVSGVSPTTSFFSRAQTGGNGFRNQSASQPSWGLSNGSTVQQNASLSQRPFSFTDTQAASSKSMAQAPVPRHPPWTGQDYGPFGRIGPPPRRTPEQLPPPKPQTFWPFKSQTGLELLLDRAMQIQEHSVVTHTIRDFFNWRLYGYERVTKRMLLVALPLAVVGDYLCKPFLQLPCIAICAITFVFLRRHSSILRRRAIRTVERDAPKPYEMPERNPNADLDAPPVYSMLDELAHEESATAWEQANELRGGFEKLLKQVNGNAIKISTHRKEHMYIDLKIPGQGLRRSMSMLLTLRILLAVSFVCNAWHNSANFEPETFYTHEFHDTHSDDANPPMPAIAKFLMLLDTSLLGLAVGCWRPTIAPFEGVDGD